MGTFSLTHWLVVLAIVAHGIRALRSGMREDPAGASGAAPGRRRSGRRRATYAG